MNGLRFNAEAHQHALPDPQRRRRRFVEGVPPPVQVGPQRRTFAGALRQVSGVDGFRSGNGATEQSPYSYTVTRLRPPFFD